MEAPEAQLIALCRAGEAGAWDQLFDLHYEPTARFVWQVNAAFTAEDVEEICQETFLTVIRSLESFQGQSQIRTWICRIAANKAHDFRERQQAQKRGGRQTTVSLDAEDPQTGLRLDLEGRGTIQLFCAGPILVKLLENTNDFSATRVGAETEANAIAGTA